MSNKVVTRFAPSPTGFMHVGSVRTALYAYLWAKKNKGIFILRIEDTDKDREVDGSIDHIVKSLKWLGIDWDLGPGASDGNVSYIQSERLEIYKKYAQILIDKGFAYPDPYTEEELETFRKKAEEEKKPFLYREYRPENFDIWDGKKPLRFKVHEIKSYKWHDAVYGDLSAGPEALDDFILIKSDGYPTYNFAHIVDDIEMNISHVMRGQEFIASTPKYISLYEALGIKPPIYATLPPIMGPDGKKKLSKRDGAKDILEYGKDGYLKEAILNFLALLGWNPGDDREIFNLQELIEVFEISKIGHSCAQLNDNKLDWINKQHIKRLSHEELEKNIFANLPLELHIPKIVPLVGERISKWSDIKILVEGGEFDFFYKRPEYEKDKLVFKNSTLEKTKENIGRAIEELYKIQENNFTEENIKNTLLALSEKTGDRGSILHPIRYALSGREQSPNPFIIGDILGKNETLERLQKALA